MPLRRRGSRPVGRPFGRRREHPKTRRKWHEKALEVEEAKGAQYILLSLSLTVDEDKGTIGDIITTEAEKGEGSPKCISVRKIDKADASCILS